MRKSVLVALAVALVVALGGTAAVVGSEGQPAAKATAKVGDINILKQEDVGWTTILSNTIKTANQKDLFIDVSLECGLYTYTQVKSKGGVKDTSKATAKIVVKVLVDGEKAYPGNVVFARRMQKLTATLEGQIFDAMSIVDGGLVLDPELVEFEEIELFLSTMDANSFNFIMDDLDAGEHVVKVKAKIVTDTDEEEGAAEAWASIGKGSVTVEEVRMIQDEDILLD